MRTASVKSCLLCHRYNPLTVRNLGREALSNSLQGFGADQAKNFIKGDDVIFSGWSQDITGQVIDAGVEGAAPAYTPYVTQGAEAVGEGIKNTADTIKQLINPSEEVFYRA